MTKTLQTQVDDDVYDAFRSWADEEHGSMAAALRDFAHSAPKGESIHADVTNDDLMDKLEELEESTGWNGGYQPSNSNGSEPGTEDTDLIENYSPDVDAEDLSDDLTPVADDADCLTKDLLDDVVDVWEETESLFDLPEINPLHISPDYRPQGKSAVIALTLSIIKYRYDESVKRSQILGVLTHDNAGLGYTEQYIKENEHRERITNHLVEYSHSSNSHRYLLDGDLILGAAQEYAEDAEEMLDDLRTPDSADDWFETRSECCDLYSKANDLMNQVGVKVSDVDFEVRSDTRVNYITADDAERHLMQQDLDAARDTIESVLDRIDGLTSLNTPYEIEREESLARDELDTAREQVASAQSPHVCELEDDPVYGDVDDVRDEIDRVEQQLTDATDQEIERATDELQEVATYRAQGIGHLTDLATSSDRYHFIRRTKDAVAEYKDMVDRHDELDDDADVDALEQALRDRINTIDLI